MCIKLYACKLNFQGMPKRRLFTHRNSFHQCRQIGLNHCLLWWIFCTPFIHGPRWICGGCPVMLSVLFTWALWEAFLHFKVRAWVHGVYHIAVCNYAKHWYEHCVEHKVCKSPHRRCSKSPLSFPSFSEKKKRPSEVNLSMFNYTDVSREVTRDHSSANLAKFNEPWMT